MAESRGVDRFFGRLLALPMALVIMTGGGLSCAAPESATSPTTVPTQPATQPPVTEPTSQTAPETVEWTADGVVNPGEYVNELSLGTYRLFWSSTDETIRMALQSDVPGWVAVGFQPGSRMKNADMVFGMMSDGVATVLDQYSSGDFGPHSADVMQGGTDDLIVSAGARTDSMTTFEFERRLDTGDEFDVPLQRGVAQQIIWAYGPSDGEKVAHSTRGYAEIVP